MGSRNLRSAVLIVVLAATVALSGCASTDSGTTTTASPANETTGDSTTPEESMSPSDVTASLDDRLSTLDSYQATVTTRTTVGDRQTNMTSQLWVRPETGEIRREVLSGPGTGTITVVNESTILTYNPRTEEVTQLNRSAVQMGTGTMDTTSLLKNSTVEVLGTEQRNGTTTYRVRITPNQTMMGGDANITAWIDAETSFPTRVETTASTAQGNVTSVVTFEDVDLNATIPDSAFSLNATSPEMMADGSMTPTTPTPTAETPTAETSTAATPTTTTP